MLVPHYLQGIYALANRSKNALPKKEGYRVGIVAALMTVAFWLAAVRYHQITSSNNSVPQRQLSPIATFSVATEYRKNSDVIFENYLDSVLAKLKMEYVSSYDPEVWPTKIFQTARTVNDKYKDAVASWSAYNPQYEHMLLGDKAATEFVERAFAASPEIVEVYKSFPNAALKADLLRYLLLYLYGGVYADVDLYCRKPISEWIPHDLAKSDADVIIGIELDEPYVTLETQRQWHWHRPYSFAQFTIVAKPFAKPIRTAIVRVVAHAHHLARLKNKSSPSKISKYTPEEVFEVSGPGMWTDVLIDSMNYRRKDVSWAQMNNLKKPIRVPTENGAIIVLPVQYFGNGQRHSNAGDYNQPEACVSHLFTKSWQRFSWF
ncbi:nucleotide-diphospho-sugar transferase [Myxozyma melibiosi]|uniref:Nucleotide-diphospho-sugar transferase n=1 Tax=Myxozyma melibiosi TaxID=54550 RepID=A0ABR1FCW5_9ASCO